MAHLDLIGRLDPTAVREVLARSDTLWWQLRFRQNAVGSPHVDTQAIFLRMPRYIDREALFGSLDVTLFPAMTEYAFAQAVARVADLAGGDPARAMLVRLAPGGHIRPHADEGAYAEATDRYHWCIDTNPACWMRCGAEPAVWPEPGEVWAFNKHILHEVRNAGTTPRVHLIVDCWRSGNGHKSS